MSYEVLKAALRRCKPVGLRATLADNTVREIAPPGGKRKRWQQTIDVLDRMAWVEVELLDAKSRTLDVVTNDEPAGDLEDLGDIAETGATAANLNLMLRAQDVALKRNAETTKQLTTAMVELSRLVVESVRQHTVLLKNVSRVMSRNQADDDDPAGLLSEGPIADLAPLLAAKLLGVPLAVEQPAASPKGGNNAK